MMNDKQVKVYGGIDTHADTHHLAVIDQAGRRLADAQIPTTATGYQAALRFLGSWPGLVSVGIECTGSYGAAVTRAVREAGITVFEVNRPNRFDRRLHGKSDPFDAYSAAEAVLGGRASAAPKGGDGLVESLRVLRTSRSSALQARTATINQIKGMLITAPEDLRTRYKGLSTPKLIAALAASRPTPTPVTAAEATAYSLRLLARRWQALTGQIEDLAGHLQRLLDDHAPDLMRVFGCGQDTIAQLLITAGDNPDRLRSEAAFAALAGVCPIPASSGKTKRHRLNRAGDRQANSALYHIVMVRLRYNQETQDYVARRTAEGKTKMEIIRCLKRYLVRQLYPLIVETLHPRKEVAAA
ncbi:IS110 family RNA-guided transposase [Brevibacterium aurantiacum]|uniref:Transposase n=4 Tax=Brevibacterium aurantiacum TaxID=273384 RepID=A0A2H1KZE8_BREAU|nr:IS110 family transposase [Brevibacterium aurantiacum]AZT96533.1 IS110 family transposase [Brevibacterium aurantiacum]AZT98820.1 IS110 family transposase [Brevibacterium aurantiacum]AZT98824.1 IS110 family transposase [Brevibacterium aurantiacum]TGD36135.1 IS110 family transposase [Brevibacterium aurantiacum]SMY05107.1 Transposase [Brevibacterium aurantiacum]